MATFSLKSGASDRRCTPLTLQRRDQQPEARDRDGERVQVHAGDGVQRPLRDVARVARRLVSDPFIDQPLEAAQQEVAGAAGRVDHPHFAEAELADGRRQRAVEDELLDELRRLQQRVALARGFRQVLVEVAEEAGVPVGVGEVVHQGAGVRVHLLPELAQRPSRRRR